MLSFRYSRWDGSQQLALDSDELLAELSDELLEHGDIRRALSRMMRQGMNNRNLMGLQEMLRRLRERRQNTLNQYDMDSIVDQIQKMLDEILDMERQGIERRLQEAQERMERRTSGPRSQSSPQRGQEEQEGHDGPQNQQDGSPDSGQDAGEQGDRGQQQQRGQQGQMGQMGQPQRGQQGQMGQQQQGRNQDGGQQGQDGQPGEDGQPDGAFSQEMANSLMKFLQMSADEKRQFLDQMPEDAPSRIQKLQDYEFMEPEAKRKFDELMEMLKQQVTNSLFNQMMQGMENLTPEQMQRMQDMLKALNRMMKDKLQGKEPNFEQFKEQFGDMFPGDPQSLEELLEQMQAQMQAMRSLMESMSQEQRQQLQGMMDNLLQDMGLRQQMMEMALALDQLFPQDRPQRYNFRGDEDVSLQQAMQIMEQLQQLQELEAQLRQAQQGDGRSLERVDRDLVRDLLGDDEAQSLDALKQLEKLLEEAGYLKRDGNKLELTARALRKIGQKSLREVFAQLKKDRIGNHNLERRGARGERAMETKPYEFGDPFHLDLEETLMNAIQRAGAGTPVRIGHDDFEVYREEHLTQSSTVLMLDLSRSMGYTGRFLAAKKTAVALASLIRTMFPRDNLYLIGFSLYAQELKHDELPQVQWNDYQSGTNMHHGFSMARRLLGKHKSGTRQILMVTDGEPTAHLEHGQAFFYYPPLPETVRQTLKEVQRCTRENITINTFMLDRTPYLMEFVGEMAKINKGRVFYTSPEKLGEYVLVDYLQHRRKTVR